MEVDGIARGNYISTHSPKMILNQLDLWNKARWLPISSDVAPDSSIKSANWVAYVTEEEEEVSSGTVVFSTMANLSICLEVRVSHLPLLGLIFVGLSIRG